VSGSHARSHRPDRLTANATEPQGDSVITWSNFLDPLIYLFDERKFTVPLGLRSLATLDRSSYPLFLAGAVTATALIVGAFLYVQRFFLQEFRGSGWLSR
jgi:multiple sugar transport system permease protein